MEAANLKPEILMNHETTRRQALQELCVAGATLASLSPALAQAPAAPSANTSSGAGTAPGIPALCALPALEIAKRIAAREVSCVEVVEAHLQHIEKTNPQVNAIVHVLHDSARAAARAADATVARGAPLAPLHGVPFTTKVNIDMAGQATTWGVVPLARAVVPLDAPVVERMRAAGAIPIGRTNMPDMALRIHTDSSLHGLTRNPWNAARTCGGSSGGDAVALATGMAAIGLGNDLGGSLRSPASACGIASIRPTQGSVPDAGLVPTQDRLPSFQMMNTQGPMARRVADVRAALRVMAGAHLRDAGSFDMPTSRPRQGPIRVAVLAMPPGGRTDPAVAAMVRRAADLLSQAGGYELVEATPPAYEAAVGMWAKFLIGDFGLVLPKVAPLMGADSMRFLEAAAKSVGAFSGPLALSELLMQRDGIARAWNLFLSETPLILSPTWTQLPFAVGADVAAPEGVGAAVEMLRPVVPANLLGLPSACVPAGIDAGSGMPVGVLLTGSRFADALCLDAAEAIERGRPPMTPIQPRGA